MIRQLRTALRCLPILLALVSLTRPAQLRAIDFGDRSTRIERTVTNRLDVLVDGADTTVQRIPLAGWVTADLLAYRFRFVALDANGVAIVLPAATSLTLRVETGAGSSQIRLSPESWELALPRPFAIRLGASDSITIVLELAGLDQDGVDLRVSIDYEATDRRPTRVPLTSVRAEGRSTVAGEVSWDWSPATDGRVLAMAGLPLGQAQAISVIDVESGATLWSSAVSALTPGTAIVAGSVLRLGVPVSAGRTYRLTITLNEPTSRSVVRQGVLAMMLPTQAR